jgi:hypothetical protein
MNDEFTTLYYFIEYVSENFIGIILLILTLIIIYVVDHINQLNSIIMTPQLYTPQLSSPQIFNNKVKTKKIKKH